MQIMERRRRASEDGLVGHQDIDYLRQALDILEDVVLEDGVEFLLDGGDEDGDAEGIQVEVLADVVLE